MTAVNARTRRLIVRAMPLTVAGMFALVTLLTAAVEPWRAVAGFTVSSWVIAVPLALGALWIGWRFGDPRHGEQRDQAHSLGYDPESYLRRTR